MRLREIYLRCKNNYSNIYNLYVQKAKVWYNSDNAGYYKRYAPVQDRIDDLRDMIEKAFRNIKCFDSIFIDIDSAIHEVEIGRELELYEKLLGVARGIIELYESMGQPVKEDVGLDVKLPKTDSITEFKKYIDDLEFIFTKCPFFQSDEASLRLKTVDVGSTWLIIGVVGVGTSVLLNNIAAFIDKCFIIRSHKATYELQKLEIQKANIEQKEKGEIAEYVKKMYKIAVKNAIKELEEITQHHIIDGDEEGRVEQSFEKLEKLIDKGLQIYSSFDSPHEVKALFEPLEMHYLPIEEKLKKIEKKSSADSDSE